MNNKLDDLAFSIGERVFLRDKEKNQINRKILQIEIYKNRF